MRLYAGTTAQFVEDTTHNQIAEKLRTSFFEYFRYSPSISEINSWRNSLRAMSLAIQHAELKDNGVILEFQLPLSSKRIDCLLCGRDTDDRDNAVIVELKQWEKTEEADGENEISAWVGGSQRDILHPAVQVARYHSYLADTHSAFYDSTSPIMLSSCAYLHNYSFLPGDPLKANKFEATLAQFPLFSADDVGDLDLFLRQRLARGGGTDVLQRVEQSKHRPSKKLMEHVANVIKGLPEYVLLDEQQVVYDRVLTSATQNFNNKQKSVIIVRGGPGTGKSVIALNLVGDLCRRNYNAHYVTGSRAFTETLRSIVGGRAEIQFKYFNSYAGAESNAVDVLVADEAHRIRLTSNSRFTPAAKRSKQEQIAELIHASRTAVFLLDDLQVVRPNEIGSAEYIRKYAATHDLKVYEYQLEAQFRCCGSDAFVNWVDNTLQVRRTANVIWEQQHEFEFEIFESPHAMEEAIRAKAAKGFSARMTAGFCWPWSAPQADGTLPNDVVVGNYRRPWNARPEARRLAHDIPKSNLWAKDPNGINQVGCVYTAQGFEFDYVGVIFGKDLTYDFDEQRWKGDRKHSYDSVVKNAGEQFVDLVKNTYRVLLSRGMRGCYVCFVDKDTERFVRSRIE